MNVKRKKKSRGGYSFLELVVVIGMISVALAMAVITTGSVLPTFRANAAMDQVYGQLRAARAMAITQRREIQVQFTAPNQINLTRIEPNGATTALPTIVLEGNAQFTVFAGVPDTPMAFGNAASVYFGGMSGGPPIMKFTSTGGFVDGGSNPLNGTVFVGIPGRSDTARAVTVLGATGRVRQYHWTGSQWME
jgi:type II secretory pathway pseudopilin PulG